MFTTGTSNKTTIRLFFPKKCNQRLTYIRKSYIFQVSDTPGRLRGPFLEIPVIQDPERCFTFFVFTFKM